MVRNRPAAKFIRICRSVEAAHANPNKDGADPDIALSAG
jgi:hypothetical protein